MPEQCRAKPNLTALNQAVERAAAEDRSALNSGEVRAVLPLSAYLDDRGTRAVWNAVRLLAAREPALYNGFVGEQHLFDTILELAEHNNYGGIRPMLTKGPVAALDWADLVTGLRARVDQEWLVGVPLANLRCPERYVELAQDAGLAAANEDPDWRRGPGPSGDPSAMERHLGGRINAGVRWRTEDQRLGPLDTRRTTLLALAEKGSRTVAFDRALTRARYALAFWCLLQPPDHDTLWPTTADWEPRPFLHHHIAYKQLGVERAREHNRLIDEHDVYVLPDDDRVLIAPFSAMRAATDVDGPGTLHARAAIAASWSLYAIGRRPSDLHRTDELLHLQAAVEAICDSSSEELTGGAARWAAITNALGVWQELHGPYTAREINKAKRLSRDLRNIAAHGSDQVLLNLGYPSELVRPVVDGRELHGSELALARVSAAVPILRHAVQRVAEQLAWRGAQDDWDDDWYRQLFAPSRAAPGS